MPLNIKTKNIPLDIDMLQITEALCRKHRLTFVGLMRLAILDPCTYVRYHNDLFPPEMHKATAARALKSTRESVAELSEADRVAQDAAAEAVHQAEEAEQAAHAALHAKAREFRAHNPRDEWIIGWINELAAKPERTAREEEELQVMQLALKYRIKRPPETT